MMTPEQIVTTPAFRDLAEKLNHLEMQVAAWAEVERARMAQYLMHCTAKYFNGHAKPPENPQ